MVIYVYCVCDDVVVLYIHDGILLVQMYGHGGV